MSRVKMAVARERRLRLLRMLCEMGACQSEVELSASRMAAKAGLTYDQVRGIMRSLVKDGQVQVIGRTLPNGGTGSNAYRVTPSGWETVDDSGVYVARASDSDVGEVGLPWDG